MYNSGLLLLLILCLFPVFLCFIMLVILIFSINLYFFTFDILIFYFQKYKENTIILIN